MEPAPSQEITGLLRAWSEGDQAALERLIPMINGEVRRIAKRFLEKERPDPTLQTTALVNEAYLRLIDAKHARWQDRAHFFAACAQIMRRILVDHARTRRAAKRGGGVEAVPLNEELVSPERNSDLVAIDEALQALGKMDPRKGRVVELRFFGGLSVEETAEVLKVSSQTVLRDWRLAKAWLLRELGGDKSYDASSMATG